jgi:mannose-P-dolichol utilization defect 1
VSKGLGLGIIAGSLLVKVPQIVKILNAKSAEGISIYSVILDLVAITFHFSYSFVKGFPFSAWGDGVFVGIQTAIIATLVFLYGYKSALRSSAFIMIYCVITYFLMAATPLQYLWTAQGFNIPILLTGKLSQAVTNYRNGGTGQLSAATCFMLLAGSAARIFTSVQETGDTMMVVIYCVSTFANAVIVTQLIYYWNKNLGPAIVAKDVDVAKSKKAKKAD